MADVYIHTGTDQASRLVDEQLDSFLKTDEGHRLENGEVSDCAFCVYDDNEERFYPVAGFVMGKTVMRACQLDCIVSFPEHERGPLAQRLFEKASSCYPLLYDESGCFGRDDAMFSPRSLSCMTPEGRRRASIILDCDPKTEMEQRIYAHACYMKLDEIMERRVLGYHGFHHDDQPAEMLRALSLGREDTQAYEHLKHFCQDHCGNVSANLEIVASRDDLKALREAAVHAEGCFEIWNKALLDCFWFHPAFHDTASLYYGRYLEMGKKLEVDSRLDAYYSGVPIDDILA